MDCDYDMQTDEPQFLLGSSQSQWQDRDMDLVRWQGSQTSSKALNDLMQEASKPTRRSPRNHRTEPILIPSPGSSSLSPEDASTSVVTPSHKSKSRVPRFRNRHAPSTSTSSSFFGSSTPASSMPSDPAQFLMALKGVSEKVRVDESRLGLGKKRATTATNGRIAKAKMNSRRGNEKENFRRSTSDVERRPSVLIKEPIIGHRSLPNLNSGLDFDLEMVNEGSSSMDVDADADEGLEHINTTRPRLPSPRAMAMPPPPVPLAKLHHLKSNPTPLPQGTVTPISKSKHITPPTPISPCPPKQQPPPAAPPKLSQHTPIPLSQSQRPPALGMRRHRPTVNSSQTVVLPERRKGFKVPLAKPTKSELEIEEIKQEKVLPTPESSQHSAMPVVKKELQDSQPTTIPIVKTDIKEEQPTSSPLPTPTDEPDADSSFGDLSFDMDADALEETMRKYD